MIDTVVTVYTMIHPDSGDILAWEDQEQAEQAAAILRVDLHTCEMVLRDDGEDVLASLAEDHESILHSADDPYIPPR